VTDAPFSFAGTDYRGPSGEPERIMLPHPPPHLGTRPETSIDTWMWYFAGWEPEYRYDSWRELAVRAPQRLPLLGDPAVRFEGVPYYYNDNRDLMAWHVRWMREAGVKAIAFEFTPTYDEQGELSTPFWGNRALELAFLGKDELGGPAVAAGPYTESMDFVIMWTNHPMPGLGSDGATPELADYMVTQYLAQPNYARIDGKPVLLLWMTSNLIDALGSTRAAADYLELLRVKSREHGLGEILILSVHESPDAAGLVELGLDGATGYHHDSTGGYTERTRVLADGQEIVDRHEDFLTQTLPGYEAIWRSATKDCQAHDLTYVVPVCPMQDWLPMERDWKSVVYDGTSFEAFGQMLDRARAVIAEHSLAPLVLVEAWNEWGEGSYLEPSMEYGFGWLQAMLDGTR
jgi:hypothetical protein